MKIGIDPGETTGIFAHGEHVTAHYQPREWEAVEVFDHLCGMWRVDTVVIERFNIQEKRTALAGTDVQWPLWIIGAILYRATKNNVDAVVMQWNHERLKVSDDMLAQRGWLASPVTEWRHANDAARHVLKFTLKEERRASEARR